jgi:hypothetical protein
MSGENCMMRNFITLLFSKYNQKDKVKEWDRSCSTNGDKRNAYMILVEKSEWLETIRNTTT